MDNYTHTNLPSEIKPAEQTLTPQGIEALRHIGLASHRAWCVSRFVPPKSKIPVHSKTSKAIDKTKPDHFTAFTDALECALKDRTIIGLGFSLYVRDFTCTVIDLDHCRDPQTGTIEPWAQAIVDRFDTFAEVSVSGTGVHIWIKSQPPGNTTRKGAVPNVEIYYRNNYIVTIGNTLPGKPLQINDCTTELARFYHEVFPADPPKPKQATQKTVDNKGRSDEDVIARLRRAKNSAKFSRLYDDGDTSEHGGDHSGADLALCNLIKIHTGDNAEQIDRIFRGSALYREKWDKRHHADGATYGEGTIRTCLDSDWDPVQEVSTVFAEDDLAAEEDAQIAAMELAAPGKVVPLAVAAQKRASENPDQRKNLLESNAANHMQKILVDFAYDKAGKDWRQYTSGYWAVIDKDCLLAAMRKVMDADKKTFPQGYKASYLRGVYDLFRVNVPIPACETDHLLSFTNGVLDLNHDTFVAAHNPKQYITWQLPFEYDPNAACNPIKLWFKETFGDSGVIQVLRAFLNATIKGRSDLHCFLELIGPGGTGKSTFLWLARALVGDENTLITELKHLENSRFEAANIYNKRLVQITDSMQNTKSVDVLKALTGGDPLRLEKKNIQGGTSFRPKALVMIAANEFIQAPDYTSGLRRRRITVFLSNPVPKERQRALDVEFKKYLPGLLNWVLGLSDPDVTRILKNAGGSDSFIQTQRDSMVATNPIVDWMDAWAVLDDDCVSYIGTAKKLVGFQKVTYENADKWLYPNYLTYCEETNIKPLSMQKFSTVLDDVCRNQLQLKGVGRGEKTRKGRPFFGLRIRRPGIDDDLPSPVDFCPNGDGF